MPAWLTPLLVQAAVGLIVVGMVRQSLADALRRVGVLEAEKLDRQVHEEAVKRVDGRIDHVEVDLQKHDVEIQLNRTRYHELNNTVQAKLR
jgi:hypothetical protein